MNAITDGWELLKNSFSLVLRKPVFLVPLFCCWAVVVGVALYLRYYWQPPEDDALAALHGYLFVFLIAYSLCAANILMLELMQQMESGEPTSLAKAGREAILQDWLKIVPIAAVWALVWFVLLILKAMTRRKRRGAGRPEPSLRDAAKTLGGWEGGPFSLWRMGLNMLIKLVRMITFLTLPAIAWEGQGPLDAVRKAFAILKQHPIQFLTSYTLTGMVALFMALPLIPIFLLDEAGVAMPDIIWLLVIVYEGMVWTLGIYLEQMTLALLYLWHMKWLHNGASGDLGVVSQPSLLDGIYELEKFKAR